MITNLNKTILLTGLFLSCMTMRSHHGNTNAVLEVEKTVKSSVKLLSSHPKEKVEVLFTTNESGNVNFVLAKTNNASLKKEIESQFYGLHFTALKQDVVNSVTLNFKTL